MSKSRVVVLKIISKQLSATAHGRVTGDDVVTAFLDSVEPTGRPPRR